MISHKLKPYGKTFLDTLLLVSQLLICTVAHSLPVSNTDLWEGATIINSSGVIAGSDERNMFGGTFNFLSTDENPDTVLFRDDKTSSFTHWVEWKTSSDITLGGINLVAEHDRAPRDIRYRGFSDFSLFYRNNLGNWFPIYEYNTHPDLYRLYGGGPNYPFSNWLELTSLVTPVTSQYFRAEFVQAATEEAYGHASGPRIVELDGYSPEAFPDPSIDVPEPSALALLFSGLVFFQRSKNGAKVKPL